jgi:hypothetical protein
MYNLGIYEIIPNPGATPLTGVWPNGVYVQLKPISVEMVSRQGWIEIINKTPYELALNFVPGGTLVQENSSKCIYHIPNGGQGLTITPQPSNSTSNTILTNILVTAPNDYVIVNTYNEDEIQWYAPVSLTPAIPQIQQQFGFLNYQTFSSSNVTNASPLVTAGSTLSQQIFLLGFDCTVAPNATASNHLLTISNIVTNFLQNSNNTLTYQIWNNTTAGIVMNEKFPVPILVLSGGAQFKPSVDMTGGLAINVYWIVQ